jgi:outer membrane protein assembly factor BamB
VFAATRGSVYRLDLATGTVLWSNDLPGLGWGIATIAGTDVGPLATERRRRDAAAAGA